MPLNAQLRLLLYENILNQCLVCRHLRPQSARLQHGIIMIAYVEQDVGMSNKHMRLQQCCMSTVTDNERSSTAFI